MHISDLLYFDIIMHSRLQVHFVLFFYLPSPSYSDAWNACIRRTNVASEKESFAFLIYSSLALHWVGFPRSFFYCNLVFVLHISPSMENSSNPAEPIKWIWSEKIRPSVILFLLHQLCVEVLFLHTCIYTVARQWGCFNPSLKSVLLHFVST